MSIQDLKLSDKIQQGTPFPIDSPVWKSVKFTFSIKDVDNSEGKFEVSFIAAKKVKKRDSDNNFYDSTDTDNVPIHKWIDKMGEALHLEVFRRQDSSRNTPYIMMDIETAKFFLLCASEMGITIWLPPAYSINAYNQVYGSAVFDTPAHCGQMLTKLTKIIANHKPSDFRGRILGNELNLLDDL